MSEVCYNMPKSEFRELMRLIYEALNPIVVYSGIESDHKTKALDYATVRLNKALDILEERDRDALVDVMREVNESRG